MYAVRYVSLCFAFFFLLASAYGQIEDSSTHNDSNVKLNVKEGFFGYKILQKNEKISKAELFEIFENNDHPELIQQFNAGSTSYNLGSVIGIPGGFILGWEIGNYISNKDVNSNLLISGGLISTVSITLSVYGLHKMKRTVKKYDNSIVKSEIDFSVESTSNGIGLIVRF